jgi:hypothetical protein
MNNASTKKTAHAEPDLAELDTTRMRVRGRGANAHKRLELPLAGVRRASGKTQAEVAEVAGMAQGDVARLEAQEDMKLSTLERYAAALGARIDVAFEYPNGTRVYLAR